MYMLTGQDQKQRLIILEVFKALPLLQKVTIYLKYGELKVELMLNTMEDLVVMPKEKFTLLKMLLYTLL